MAIDSVNPTLVPGGAGESEIAAFIADWATGEGLEAERLEAAEGRPSVIVRARGSGNGRTLLLCGHIDTVGVEGMTDPHSPRIDGDRLYGRGAYDMKAGVAAALMACREAAGLGLAGDVVVAAVADEEHAASASGGARVAGRRRGDRHRAHRAAAVQRASRLRVARDRGQGGRRTARGSTLAWTRS